MTGKRSPKETGIFREKIRKGLLIIAFLFVPSLLLGENLSGVPNPEGLVIDKALLENITLPVKHEKGSTLSFLQKSLTPSFRRKPESRIARKSWIPGRASLARNDDFLLLSRVLQEAPLSETSRIIAMEQGLSPKLVDSIIQAESNGDARAVSRKGAMGLMQLMPGTAKEYQVSDPFDPGANIRGGARYLKDLLEEFAGNLSLALAAYNAGPSAVKKYQGIPPFPETQDFVRKVQDRYLSETNIPSNLVFASKTQEIAPLDKGSGKIIISGSPREVAAFLKYMKKDKPEVKNR